MSVVRIRIADGHGTGIVVARSSDTAFVITARHVLHGEIRCEVYVGGSACEATLDQEDSVLDLALLRIRSDTFVPKPVTFAERLPMAGDRSASRVAYGFRDTDDLEPGPQSLEGNLISGGTHGATFQLAGSELYPGFSGGPLFLVTGNRSLCVGMTLRGNSERTSAASSVFLHSSEIVRLLRSWGVDAHVQTAERSNLQMLVRILAPVVLIATAGYLSFIQYSSREELRDSCRELVGKVNFHLRDYVTNSASAKVRELARQHPEKIEDPDETGLKGAVDQFCRPVRGGN